VTHWLDGSNIYGSTAEDAARLRDPTGRLRISSTSGGAAHLLPSCRAEAGADQPEACEACESEDRNTCFLAGDVRVNEQPNLVVLHTLFMREHNRMADLLAELNPSWRPERLFQEARRITVAEYQHVVYKEWLPTILGNNYMRLFGLLPMSAGHSTDYQDNFDPRINNEFAAAAFRFGHSMVAGTFHMVDNLGSAQPVNLSDVFFQPRVVRSTAGSLGKLVRGLVSEAPRALDSSFVDQLRNHLFETRPGRGGLDLVAINIQRGRDHGLPGYIRYLDICSGKKISDWADLNPILGVESVKRLKTIYRNPEDVDLYIGGVLEASHEDALVGTVFKCIIGDQFARLKKGDRFFYDLGLDQRTAFSAAQLDAIRTTTMARLLCENTDIEAVQPFAFKLANSDLNAVRDCAEILSPAADWNSFKEN
jgi:peroxidase